MGRVLEVLRGLIGRFVWIVYESGSGVSYDIGGVLEKVEDEYLVIRRGRTRVVITNAVIVEVHDLGDCDA